MTTDHYSALFAHFTPVAQAFYSGSLCETVSFADDRLGHLHVFRRGTLTVIGPGEASVTLAEPAALFFPRGSLHSFLPDPTTGAELVCATVDMGARQCNPITLGLPEVLVIPFAQSAFLAATCELLFAEAFAEQSGRTVALNRLFDYFLIQVFRHAAGNGQLRTGTLAALADPQLARALSVMHTQPQRTWTLEELADIAGMSRTSFASRFKSVVGATTLDYLTRWRISRAQQLLAQGRSVKHVAGRVGYESAASFSRAFTKVSGQSPRAWTHRRPANS